jgi:ATP-dependent RNA helicase RhlE
MGFIHDVKRIIALLPAKRQNLLFSATMPESIAGLAAKILKNPVRVDISPDKPTVELIDQSIIFAEKDDKRRLLSAYISGQNVQRALVFTRTKHGADRLVKQLEHDGISSAAIHANKSQNNRIKTLEGFRSGDIRILVATDLAARGIDVDGITHVFNFELPNEPETYVHRIGRTARAGASGIAIAFCDSEEKGQLHDIERLIGRKIPLAFGPAIDEARKAAAEAKAAEPPRDPDARDREPYFSRSGRERPRPSGERGAAGGRSSYGARPTRPERISHSDRPAQGRGPQSGRGSNASRPATTGRAVTESRAAQAVREVSGRIDRPGRSAPQERGGAERRPPRRPR